jgi:Domain of unknown function (DUF4157)
MRRTQALARPVYRNAGANILQRQCACGAYASGGSCGKCGSTAPPLVQDALKSPGRPLDSQQRQPAENQFGQDLSHVRVHTGESASASAAAVGALAYSVGPDLVFGAGQFAPSTQSGQKLLTHELTHAVQQPQLWSGGDLKIGDASSPSEREAEAVSRSDDSPASRGSVLPGMIQRQAAPPGPAGATPAGTSPADFGISLVVVDHGATDAHAAAEARLQEIYSHVNPANLAQMKASGITKVELHVIPEDAKLPDIPGFSSLKGKDPDAGRKWGAGHDPSEHRTWDETRGEGGIREGSTIRIAVGEETLVASHHHGWAIGLGIGLGVALGAAGAALGFLVGGSKQSDQINGGIAGGVIGSAVGAAAGGLLGNLEDKSGGYKKGFSGAHESSHSVEMYALSPPQRTELTRLFTARKAANGPWLPPADYTSSDEREYWAQCSAAYFSHADSSDDDAVFTPAWLQRNDPGMYNLIMAVYTNPSAGMQRTASENQSLERAAA